MMKVTKIWYIRIINNRYKTNKIKIKTKTKINYMKKYKIVIGWWYNNFCIRFQALLIFAHIMVNFSTK